MWKVLYRRVLKWEITTCMIWYNCLGLTTDEKLLSTFKLNKYCKKGDVIQTINLLESDASLVPSPKLIWAFPHFLLHSQLEASNSQKVVDLSLESRFLSLSTNFISWYPKVETYLVLFSVNSCYPVAFARNCMKSDSRAKIVPVFLRNPKMCFSDWKYNGCYDNDRDDANFDRAKGFNYHNGPVGSFAIFIGTCWWRLS